MLKQPPPALNKIFKNSFKGVQLIITCIINDKNFLFFLLLSHKYGKKLKRRIFTYVLHVVVCFDFFKNKS